MSDGIDLYSRAEGYAEGYAAGLKQGAKDEDKRIFKALWEIPGGWVTVEQVVNLIKGEELDG